MVAGGPEKTQPVFLDALSTQVADGDTSGLAKLFAEAGLPAPVLRWQPAVDDLPVEPLRFLLRHWTELPRDGDLPHFKSVDAFALRPALGHVNLLEVIDAGRDLRYRVFGSKVSDRMPFDMSGRHVSELPTGPTMICFFLAVYQAVMARREPVYTRHEPPAEMEVEYWDRLCLPLVDDGGAVVRMLSGHVAGPWRRARGA